MSITSRRTRVGYTMVDRAGTKTTAGSRVIDLDPETTAALKRWREVQTSERSTWGDAYLATGYVFTAENGEPVHADHVMQRFERLLAAAKVPGIRFHDLRVRHEAPCIRAG
jgi:integrase